MARALWPFTANRPVIEIFLADSLGGRQVKRTLLADSGAGNAQAPFQILLEENDCLLYGGVPVRQVPLAGAYAGSFPLYLIPVEIPALGFSEDVPALGVPTPPAAFDGIACFSFINRFTYGNFADPTRFGLEI
jgi:hypothetical protein